MKRLSLFLIFSGICWVSASYGQSNENYALWHSNEIIPPSPNAASLGIYGGVPIGHYTGVPNISIPIHEIESGEVSLPIALSYHASGIKVAQEASSVGLGWILNAGGCIVREVKHMDDFGSGGYYFDQSFPVATGNNDNKPSDRSEIFYPYLYKEKDSEPDIFRYNFGDMSGSFFFEKYNDNNSKTLWKAEAIISNKDRWLKIVCNRTSSTAPDDYGGYVLNFDITDAYGNNYHFGSREYTKISSWTINEPPDEDYIDRSYIRPYWKETQSIVPTAWYLDKIITSKRDTIKFEYEKERIYSPVRVSEDVSSGIDADINGGSDPIAIVSFKYYNMSYTETDQLLLKKISFSSGEINFNYVPRMDIEYADFEKTAQKLNYLTVKNMSGDIIKKVSFTHSYLGNIGNDPTQNALYSRLLLESVNMEYPLSGIVDHKYSFKYNRNNLPAKNSRYTDHWGYYNEGQKPLFTQGFHYSPPINFTYIRPDGYIELHKWKGINKNSNKNRSQYGILTSIQYPTGGRTDFEYELNDFNNGFFDSIDTVKNGGGLRIKKICDLSNNADTTSVRSFIYKKDGVSSGILMSVPAYHVGFIMHFYGPLAHANVLFLNGTSSPYTQIMGSASGMYVGYSYVEERNITHGVDNGYVAHSFKNKANRTIDLGERLIRNYPSIPSMDNGLPLGSTYFDSRNNAVKTTNFEYMRVEKDSIKGLMCDMLPMVNALFYVKFYDIYSERWLLNKKTEKQNFPGNKEICIITEYDYNNTNWLKKYEKNMVLGADIEDTYETTVKYPTDFGSAYSGMVSQNMIGIPVEITTKKNGNIISAYKTAFGSFNNGMYLPQAYYNLDISTGTYYPQVRIDRYDGWGNILQFSETDNIPTVYLWSYNGQYPIAEIKNATYSQVEAALGAFAIATINDYRGASTAVPDFDTYGAILRSMLPNSLVSVYTYQPLVGGTGITDPSGRKTRYSYDPFNRLSSVRDDVGPIGNLVRRFKYKISNSANPTNYVSTQTYIAENDSQYVADISYYDGLGYLSQSVSIGASPQNQNVITPVYYDSMMRESRKYLPYAAPDNSNSYTPDALSAQVRYYNNRYGSDAGGYSYAENEYEASPLNRVTVSYNVGTVFRINDKKSTFDYGTNNANEVIRFNVSLQKLQTTGFHNANTLFKNTVINEDGASAVTYKDFLDRVLLERVIDSADNNAVYDTYYVYDDIGNLCYVLPPKLSETAASWKPCTVTDAEIKELAYIYKYDGRNRCIEKCLPGAEPVYMIYDKGNRLVMSQDGNMRDQHKWIYTEYDAQGRTVRQSILVSQEPVASSVLQNGFNNTTIANPYNPLNSGFSEDVMLTTTVYDAYVYGDETEIISIDKIPVGTNIRGWTFKVIHTELFPAFSNDIECSIYLNGNKWISLLYYVGDPIMIYCNASIQATEENIGSIYDGNWDVSEGYTFTIKDDRDYIVTGNDLSAGSHAIWGFDKIVRVRR